jgi:pantoate kinase
MQSSSVKEDYKTSGCVRAYAPGHITGFFTIHMDESPLLSGSTGAGLCLEEGVTTEVSIEPSKAQELVIMLNGGTIEPAPTCKSVFRAMVPQEDPVKITARQASILPANFGYGISGAAALSLGLALNEALGLGLSREKVGQIAHQAEVENLTGLGDVPAQLVGGSEVRLKPGAPGIGEVKNLGFGDGFLVISSPVASFPTRRMITEEPFVKRINSWGKVVMGAFMESQTMENFMGLSRKFWENVGMMSEDVTKAIRLFESAGIPSPSAKKGVVFGAVYPEDAPKIINKIMGRGGASSPKGFSPVNYDLVHGLRIIISRISERGAC